MHFLSLQNCRSDLPSQIFVWTNKDIDRHIWGWLIGKLTFHVGEFDRILFQFWWLWSTCSASLGVIIDLLETWGSALFEICFICVYLVIKRIWNLRRLLRFNHEPVYHLLIQFDRSRVTSSLIHVVRISFKEVVWHDLLWWNFGVINLFQLWRHIYFLLNHYMTHWLSYLRLILMECNVDLLQTREIIELDHRIMLFKCMLSYSTLRHRAGSHCLKFLAIIPHYLLVLRIIFGRSLCDWSELMLMVELMLQMFHFERALKRFHMTILRRDQHIVVYVIRDSSSSSLLIGLKTYLWLVIG